MNIPKQMISWLRKYNIWHYTLEPDPKYGYVINVVGDVFLHYKNLISIPYKFGKVTGGFYCYENNLTSLENSPDEIRKFDCSHNPQLRSLEGGPKIVSENYCCYSCDLHTLKGAPVKVEYFNCSYNKNLSSLDYAPRYTKVFDCSHTNIKQLQPQLVITDLFNASGTSIKDLIGCPQNCKAYLLDHCLLRSLDGLPEHGGYKIRLENSLDMIPIDNIKKNLMKLRKPIILLYWHDKKYYNHILSRILPIAKQKILDIRPY